jgi:hypothetical protein
MVRAAWFFCVQNKFCGSVGIQTTKFFTALSNGSPVEASLLTREAQAINNVLNKARVKISVFTHSSFMRRIMPAIT